MARYEQQPSRPDAELSEVDLLLRLARRWRRLGAEAMSEEGLSPHQERGLLALARFGRRSEGDHAAGVRVSHLADHLGIAPRSATEVADALEAAGLVERSPDPTDRRAVLLTLTESGRHAVAEVRDRRRSAAEEAMSALTPDDRADLRRILMQLLAD
ncbi:MarR family winged helix-turn-helix transcriptional regulator [Ornithinimicrobium sufpigmenti]|uniref:MarR family winged helix-turn-helix transcriptional regulator n=1 Tax=Ornithinimicrobium sufpigmenti TaxID=2508882 RepID=UPI0010363AD1|nr:MULTISPECIES: MarR family transcriptional regulator [unclassified Ornithinimicrobium]